jgi:hypothetical protein
VDPAGLHENHTDEGAIIFAVYRKPNIYPHSVGFADAKKKQAGSVDGSVVTRQQRHSGLVCRGSRARRMWLSA